MSTEAYYFHYMNEYKCILCKEPVYGLSVLPGIGGPDPERVKAHLLACSELAPYLITRIEVMDNRLQHLEMLQREREAALG